MTIVEAIRKALDHQEPNNMGEYLVVCDIPNASYFRAIWFTEQGFRGRDGKAIPFTLSDFLSDCWDAPPCASVMNVPLQT